MWALVTRKRVERGVFVVDQTTLVGGAYQEPLLGTLGDFLTGFLEVLIWF